MGRRLRLSSRITRTRTKHALPAGNPYRAILARSFPEPAIVMLCFLWAIWLYDGYLGPPAEAPSDTCKLALQSIDRRLRLAETFSARPEWQRWVAGVPPRAAALDHAIQQLDEVAIARRLDDAGGVVRAVLIAAAGHRDAAERFLPDSPLLEARVIKAALAGRDPHAADLAGLARLVAGADGRWWHLELARPHAADPAFAAALARQQQRGEAMAGRVLTARVALWLLVAIGAFLAPAGLRMLRSGLRRAPSGYPSRWPFALAIGIFLVCELAGIGIAGAYGFLNPGSAPVFVSLGIESVTRLIPAGLACAFLFHRARHAARCFGLHSPVPWGGVLGVFALVFVVQEFVALGLDRWLPAPVDPTGGIDAWSAGWAGLVAMLVAACLVAPLGEEILYRGVLFQGFVNRFGVWPAAVASALIFTVVHFYGLHGTVSVGILGVALALVYHATRSLPAVIVFHAVYNLGVTVPDWLIDHGPL